ncbi:MAG TPA: sigma-54 dependent transcriptional regulator [Terriglobales bacterium]|nr:sigma-54 dependent transcriptional regulator [Terriglobales bacterium]
MILRAWVAADSATVRLIQEARSIARTSSTVLIRGESGSGKDLLAWILHALSSRADRPFVRVDCASLPPELIESELFGQELVAGHFGRIETAAGGTLVLDEVSALSIPAQAKLLRVIEERRFERLGGARSIGVDARIVALTNINLEQAVLRRVFREDLFYRLNVIPMVIPALRERVVDIRPLALHFLDRYSQMNRRTRMVFGGAVMEALESYSWPGNVRELRDVVEKAVQNATGTEITLLDLPQPVRDCAAGAIRTKLSLQDLERNYIAEVLEHTKGKKTLAAKILGISRKTLLEKRKRYGFE